MKPLSNVHTHTTWCDGDNTVREMAQAAIDLGFTGLGFSSHSPAPFDPTCPGIQDEDAYCRDIASAKEEFAGKLDILCGTEQDYYAPANRQKYDYIIGSAHYLPVDKIGQYNAVDSDDIENLLHARTEFFGGDGAAMAASFFCLSAENARKYKPDIIGHYDVVTKFNATAHLFDEESPRYKNAALEPLDEIIDTIADYGGMIEVNTAAMVRGLREVPYPAPFLLRHMAQRGTRAIITSDSHRTSNLGKGFEQALGFLREAGFRRMAVFSDGRFIDVEI